MFESPGRGRFGLAVFVLAFTASRALVADPLNPVVQKVLQQHPDVAAAEALLRASDQIVNQAWSNFFPVVGVSYQHYDGVDIGLTSTGVRQRREYDRTQDRSDAVLRWNVFNGLTDYNTLKSSEHSREAAESDLQDMLEEVAFRVTQSYVDVLRLNSLVDNATSNVADLQRLAQFVDKRVEIGRMSVVDNQQTTVRLTQSQNDLARYLGQKGGAESAFLQLTGLPPKALVEPTPDLSLADESLDNLMEQAKLHNFRLKAALARLEAREADVGAATGKLMPTVDFEARKRVFADQNPTLATDSDHSTLLRVNYDFPVGGANITRRAEAIERRNAALAQAQGIELELKTSLVQLQQQLKALKGIYPQLQENFAVADRLVHSFDLQFDAGRRSLLELLIVRSQRFDAQTAYLDNRFQQTVIAARIARLVGRLRESLFDHPALPSRGPLPVASHDSSVLKKEPDKTPLVPSSVPPL